MHHRRLPLRRETLRVLAAVDLVAVVAGGRRAGTTSEAEGNGPCPGEYSWTCSP